MGTDLERILLYPKTKENLNMKKNGEIYYA